MADLIREFYPLDDVTVSASRIKHATHPITLTVEQTYDPTMILDLTIEEADELAVDLLNATRHAKETRHD